MLIKSFRGYRVSGVISILVGDLFWFITLQSDFCCFWNFWWIPLNLNYFYLQAIYYPKRISTLFSLFYFGYLHTSSKLTSVHTSNILFVLELDQWGTFWSFRKFEILATFRYAVEPRLVNIMHSRFLLVKRNTCTLNYFFHWN